MKKLSKVLSIVLLLVLSCVLLTGCKEDKTLKVGIIQLVTHDALGACTQGFVDGLAEAGFVDGENCEIIIKNPEGDATLLEQFASQLVESCDLVFGVATDSAIALKNARDNAGLTIPVLFSAVTDPIAAGLVASATDTSNNVTGTSDDNDVATQVDMVKAIIPTAKTVTVLYHTSEVNSQVQAAAAKIEGEKQGLTVKIETVSEVSELAATLSKIAESGTDAVYLPTDNLMASNMAAITEALNAANILTVCGEEGMVNNGGAVSYSISYTALGKMTGSMAGDILSGKKAVTDVDVLYGKDGALVVVINENTLTAIGLNPTNVKATLESLSSGK